MTDTPEVADRRYTISWITSLAITVACCATQFVVFAGYIFDLKENLAAAQLRSTILEQRLNSMNVDVETMHRHMYGQPTVSEPSGSNIQLPVPLTPDAKQLPPASAVPATPSSVPPSVTDTAPAAAPGSTPTVPAEVPTAPP